MARNIFQGLGDMWTGGNSDNTGKHVKQENETNEEYFERIKSERDKAIKNLAQFKEARKLGLIDNGMTFDQYLIDSGKATEINVNDDGSATVNGRYMSAEDYENWYNNVRK